jgi:hypothetical protein
MKITNKKRKILRLWKTPEEMRKDLILDNENQKIWNRKTGNQLKFSLSCKNKYYFSICLYKDKKKHTLLVHQLFFFDKYGYLPPQIDHIDQNQFNNHLSNLRPSTAKLNSRNRKVQKSSSRYRNVHKKIRKSGLVVWEAYFHNNYKKKHLRTFRTEDEAGQAVNDKIRELGLEGIAIMNDTPQERARKNIQFAPLPPEMNHIRDLFLNIEPLVDFK